MTFSYTGDFCILAKTSLFNGDESSTVYILNLQESFQIEGNHSEWYKPTSPQIQVHDLQPGDRVLIEVFSRQLKLEPRVGGGIYHLIKFFAVKVTEREAWIHHSHVK